MPASAENDATAPTTNPETTPAPATAPAAPDQRTTAELRAALLEKLEKADLTGDGIGQESGSPAGMAGANTESVEAPAKAQAAREKTSDQPKEKTQKETEKTTETPGENAGDSDATQAKEDAPAPTPEEIASERRRLQEERAALNREREAFDAQAAAARGELQRAMVSADQLEKYAAEWREEGRDDLADAAIERAQYVRENARAAGQKAAQADFQRKQAAVIREVVAKHPDLSNPESVMYRTLEGLLQKRPVLGTYPEGIRDAVELIEAHQGEGRREEMQSEIAKLKEQIKAQERRLQPANGRPSAHRGEPSFAKLSLAEQRARLLEQLQTAEQRGEPAFSRR